MKTIKIIGAICFLAFIEMSFGIGRLLNPPIVYSNQLETDSTRATLIAFVQQGSIGIKTYRWVQISGNNVSFVNSSDTLQFPSVSGLTSNNIYKFILTVTDSNNLTGKGTLIIRTYSLAAIHNGIMLNYIGNKIGGFSR